MKAHRLRIAARPPSLGTALACAGLLLAGLPAPSLAQGVWVPHKEPCELNTGHYLVKGSQVHLKLAVESRFPDERDGRLEEAKGVLFEAILEKGQGDNPAAWYYLGRTYVEQLDYVGADTAFRRAAAGAPACADDIAKYTGKLASLSLNEALRIWGEGHTDSAKTYFGYALALDTADAETPLYASMMLASTGELDSAAFYLERGIAAAESDTAHGLRLKQAQLGLAQAYESRAMQNTPAAVTIGLTRVNRDTAAYQVARDSALFDRIVSDVQEIRAGGQRLNAQSLAAFQRDSTLLANRLATNRHARDSLTRRAAEDSTAVANALAPAIRYYAAFVEAHPEEADPAIQLVRLYSTVGDRGKIAALVERLAESPYPTTSALVQAGLSLYNDGLVASAKRLVETALGRNPYDHTALAVITYVYRSEGRADALMETGQQRLALAPLDPSAARTVAMAWEAMEQPDSVARWLARADTGLGWHVRISQFQPGEENTSLSGTVTNATDHPQPPLALAFEFLNEAGEVLFTHPVTIPALEPKAREPLRLRIEQGGAASWRYRRE